MGTPVQVRFLYQAPSLRIPGKDVRRLFFFSPDDRSKVMDSKFKPGRIGMILVEDIPKEDASSITNADVTVERSLS